MPLTCTVASLSHPAFSMYWVSKQDALEVRSAAALTLQQFDCDLRRLGITRIAGRIARDRRYVVDSLRAMGGEPWEYSPTEDNSWLPK